MKKILLKISAGSVDVLSEGALPQYNFILFFLALVFVSDAFYRPMPTFVVIHIVKSGMIPFIWHKAFAFPFVENMYHLGLGQSCWSV